MGLSMVKQEGNEGFQEEAYKMVIKRLAIDAQNLERILGDLPEGVDLSPGVSLVRSSGFAFTSEVEPIGAKGPVDVSFYSSPSVQAFAAELGLLRGFRLDVGLQTDTDDEGTFRRLRERIEAGEEIGDTTYLFDSQGGSRKLSFLPDMEVQQRDIVVEFADGGVVPSTMNPGDIELAHSVLHALTKRALSLSNDSGQESAVE